jgi:hypothetical protein
MVLWLKISMRFLNNDNSILKCVVKRKPEQAMMKMVEQKF